MSTEAEAEAENEKDDAEEEKAQQLLEDKRCAICQQVIVNACRVSCGHSYCRQCIDTQLDDTSPDGRNQRCVICDAKIDEVQNSPELDKEINALFSRMPSQKQLDREGVKAEKKRTEDEKRHSPSIPRIDHPANQNNSEPSSDAENGEHSTSCSRGYGHVQREERPDGHQHLYGTDGIPLTPREDGIIYLYPSVTQNNLSGHQNENSFQDESDNPNENATPPVVLHETFTIHRTSVVNPGSNDLIGNTPLNQHAFQEHQPQQPMMPPYYYNYNVPPPCNFTPQPCCNYQPYHPCSMPPPQFPYPPYGTFPNQCYSGQPQLSRNNPCGPMYTNYDNFASCPYDYYELQLLDVIPPTSRNFIPPPVQRFNSRNGCNSHGGGMVYDGNDSDSNIEPEGLNIQINVNFEMPNEPAETTTAENTDVSGGESDSEYNAAEFGPRVLGFALSDYNGLDDPPELELVGIFRID